MMKKLPTKSLLCCALCVAAGTTLGQPSTYRSSSSSTDTNRDQARSSVESSVVGSTARATESTKFVKSKDLVGADIKDSQGEKIGDISELVINHSTGETFASVNVSGGRVALVPIQAFQVTRSAGMIRNAVVTLNSTKQDLASGPTIAKNEWNRLDEPSFVQSIYSHYNLQQPSAVGGSEDSSLSGSSTGSTSKDSGMKHNRMQGKTHDSDKDDSTQNQNSPDSENK